VTRIVLRLTPSVKREVYQLRHATNDKGLAIRCQIVLLRAKGRPRSQIAESLGCSISWVDRVLARFREDGVAGLHDRREDNGTLKLDEGFLSMLFDLVDDTPQDYGFTRPTWTRELLAKLMHEFTGIRVHVGTMSRALKTIGARRGRPRPTVACPWSAAEKQRKMAEIHQMLATLGEGDVAVYLDEVDVHLNPKIGLDWMNCGTQKEVLTPGKNQKRYLCGTLDASTGLLTWVRSERKNSLLFIAMLQKLSLQTYPDAKVIHVILDNYRIHNSKISQSAVKALQGRVKLHFLPPYSPDQNRIERVWLDLHANVTRNHRCQSMEALMQKVSYYLMARNNRRRSENRAGPRQKRNAA
jgi:transposase